MATVRDVVDAARGKTENDVIDEDLKPHADLIARIIGPSFPITQAFLDMHHYHVKAEDKAGDVVLVGMFASLYCAAHTAHFGKVKGCYVLDTETGWVYEGAELNLTTIPRPKAPADSNVGDAWLA